MASASVSVLRPPAASARRVAPLAGQGLQVRDVSVVYPTSRGPLTALEGLNLDVAPSEFVAVLGPSGCGKSTLLKLVSGLLAPSAGSLRLGGLEVVEPRADVGIVFQQPTLLPWKTVYQNLLVPVRAMGHPERAYAERAMDLLRLVGLDKFRDHYPKELSGGMQQRVGVARGLIHDPTLLLMDEPFAALDAMTRERMMVELQQIWESTRKSVLFITHSIQEAVFLADRIVVLSGRPGRVLEEVEVRLPRPRRIEDLGEPGFVQLANHLRRLFDRTQP